MLSSSDRLSCNASSASLQLRLLVTMPEVYTLKWTWRALCPYLHKQCCDSYRVSFRMHERHASE
eukprot:8163399-Prorocentrum_lima.AAC.1